MKGFTLIEFLIVMSLLSLLGWLMVIMMQDCTANCINTIKKVQTKEEHTKQVCEEMGLVRKMEDLPVACLKYYQQPQ